MTFIMTPTGGIDIFGCVVKYRTVADLKRVGHPVDGEDPGWLGQQKDHIGWGLPHCRRRSHHHAEHHGGPGGLPQGDWEAYPAGAALHGHRELHHGNGEGRRGSPGVSWADQGSQSAGGFVKVILQIQTNPHCRRATWWRARGKTTTWSRECEPTTTLLPFTTSWMVRFPQIYPPSTTCSKYFVFPQLPSSPYGSIHLCWASSWAGCWVSRCRGSTTAGQVELVLSDIWSKEDENDRPSDLQVCWPAWRKCHPRCVKNCLDTASKVNEDPSLLVKLTRLNLFLPKNDS